MPESGDLPTALGGTAVACTYPSAPSLCIGIQKLPGNMENVVSHPALNLGVVLEHLWSFNIVPALVDVQIFLHLQTFDLQFLLPFYHRLSEICLFDL